ncbi:MAG: alpha/beta fold hydrolase [Vulcanimicrobiota bacterium]
MRDFRRHKVLSSRGTRLAVFESGHRERPTVFFVHGAAGSTSNWHYQLHDLKSDYHVVSVDLRGHGHSSWPGHSSLEEFHGDIDAVLSGLELDCPMVVVAHSFGGCLATHLAERRPDLVKGLALFDTAGEIPKGVMYRLLLLFSTKADLMRKQFPWMLAADAKVIQSVLTFPIKEWDCWDVYPRLQMPVFVAAGAMDVLIPARLSRRVAELAPRSRLEVVAGAGHVLMMEKPELVNGWLREFVSQCLGSESQQRPA